MVLAASTATTIFCASLNLAMVYASTTDNVNVNVMTERRYAIKTRGRNRDKTREMQQVVYYALLTNQTVTYLVEGETFQITPDGSVKKLDNSKGRVNGSRRSSIFGRREA